jgi:hypothetical protein
MQFCEKSEPKIRSASKNMNAWHNILAKSSATRGFSPVDAELFGLLVLSEYSDLFVQLIL